MTGKLSNAAAAVLAMALLSGSARAEDAASFYAGRTINLAIGYTVGGGYDLNARLLSKYMGKYIPGTPYVTPQNMPGAGSLKAFKWLYAIAPKDGTAIATFGRSMPVEPLLGVSSDIDSRKFTWLGSVTSDVSVCVTWHTSQIKTIDDLMTKEARLAGQGAGSDPDVFTSVLKNTFNPKLKLVTGYPGSNEAGLAMERGEVDGECGVSWSTVNITHPEWVKNHEINVLIQMALEKHPDLPDVTLMTDLAKDLQTRQMLKVIVASQTWARPFAAPPGLSPEMTKVLRTAFEATMKDPDYLAEAKMLKLEVMPVSGEKISRLMDELYATPPDVIAKAQAAAGGAM